MPKKNIVSVAIVVTPAVRKCLVSDNRSSVFVVNYGSYPLFVGGPDVTADNGFPIPAAVPSDLTPVDIRGQDDLYGITYGGDTEVRLLIVP